MEGLDIKQMITMVHSIADEKNLSEDEVMQAVEAAIAAAWRRDNGTREMNVRAELNREDGTAKVIVHYDVVETPEGIGQITLEEAKKNGTGVLLVSTELEEITSLSDRIIVIHEGKITGELSAGEANENNLGLLMMGGTVDKKSEGGEDSNE